MKKYINSELGNVIVVRNFVFENNIVDHAYDFGRLCVILYIDGEYEYIVPITSRKVGDDNQFVELNEDLISFYYNNNFLLGDKKNNKRSYSKLKNKELYGYINLKNVYKISSFYHDEVCKLNYDGYVNIMNKIRELHIGNISDISIDTNIRTK